MERPETGLRINVGCGLRPTPGWMNFDNSLSVFIARISGLGTLAWRLGLVSDSQKAFIDIARTHGIIRADATKSIPLPDNSVEVVYSCHVLEHLDPDQGRRFLREIRRVLKKDGIVRIVVPDLRELAETYVTDGDGDAFMTKSLLAEQSPKNLRDKLRYLLIGPRGHLWMYDESSLAKLLTGEGFKNPQVLTGGHTMITDPGSLDLLERNEGSVCVEARA